MISLTDFFDAASRRHSDVILLPASQSVWQRLCSVRTMHRHTAPRTCKSLTAASRNAKLFSVQSVASKQHRSQSCGLRDLGCHAAVCLPQTNPYFGWIIETAAYRCLVRSCSRFLTRLLTSGEEDIERVSMLNDISSTACELTMLILSISVTFNATVWLFRL